MNSRKTLVIALLAGLFAQQATADEPPSRGAGDSSFSGLPFDLLPPGARALGLGGAFVGVADDATAALANPAGLTILTAAEVSVHFRSSDADVEFLDQDAYDSAQSAQAGVLNKTFSDSGSDVSFASVVKPLGDRWVVSGFYSNKLSFSAMADDSVLDAARLETYTNENAVSADVESFGLSAAFRATDRLSIGLTVEQQNLDMTAVDLSSSDAAAWLHLQASALAPQFTLQQWKNEIVDDGIFQSQVDDSDSDTTFSVGVLFNATDALSIGLVFKQGAEFNLGTTQLRTTNYACQNTGAEIYGLCQTLGVDGFTDGTESESVDQPFAIPDILSLGIGWRLSDTWLLSFDVNNIAYSDSVPVRNVTQFLGLDVDNVADRAGFEDETVRGLSQPLTESIDDSTSFHIGVEKVFLRENNNTFTIRGGAYTVEDHDGATYINSDDTVLTFGMGATFGSRGQMQLDLGASFSDLSDTIIVSGIYRF